MLQIIIIRFLGQVCDHTQRNLHLTQREHGTDTLGAMNTYTHTHSHTHDPGQHRGSQIGNLLTQALQSS